MINHVVLIKFKPNVTDADIEDLEKSLDDLPNRIVEIHTYEFGRDLLHTARSYDFALVALFANLDAVRRYQEHPAHLKVLQSITRLSETILTVDFEGTDAGQIKKDEEGAIVAVRLSPPLYRDFGLLGERPPPGERNLLTALVDALVRFPDEDLVVAGDALVAELRESLDLYRIQERYAQFVAGLVAAVAAVVVRHQRDDRILTTTVWAMSGLVITQIVLGVFTVLLNVPKWWALTHQGVGVLLVASVVVVIHRVMAASRVSPPVPATAGSRKPTASWRSVMAATLGGMPSWESSTISRPKAPAETWR